MIRHSAPALCDWCDEPATVKIADVAALDGHHRACPVHSVAAHLPGLMFRVSDLMERV